MANKLLLGTSLRCAAVCPEQGVMHPKWNFEYETE